MTILIEQRQNFIVVGMSGHEYRSHPDLKMVVVRFNFKIRARVVSYD